MAHLAALWLHALVLCLVLCASRRALPTGGGHCSVFVPLHHAQVGREGQVMPGWAAARGQWVWEARSIPLSGRPVDAACRYQELLQRGRRLLCASPSGGVRSSEALARPSDSSRNGSASDNFHGIVQKVYLPKVQRSPPFRGVQGRSNFRICLVVHGV